MVVRALRQGTITINCLRVRIVGAVHSLCIDGGHFKCGQRPYPDCPRLLRSIQSSERPDWPKNFVLWIVAAIPGRTRADDDKHVSRSWLAETYLPFRLAWLRSYNIRSLIDREIEGFASASG